MALLAQIIYQSYLNSQSKLLAYLLLKARNLLLKVCNPTIKCHFRGFTFYMPLSHTIFIVQKRYPSYDMQLRNIAQYIYNKKSAFSMVDVGSNIGDTCCFVGLNDASYLLCEGEKSYANLIAKNIELNFGKKVMGGGYNENTKPQFLLYECFLGDKMGHYTISLRDGSGTLQSIEDKGNTLQDFESVKIRTLDSVIAETHFAPHFIKIDTDGFDFKVLRGAKQTLTENQSVLFFEWDKNHLVAQDENPLSIFSLLNELGYKELLIFDNFGTLLCKIASDDSTNLALLIDYTLKSRQNIYYYDVLTFHKDSLFNAKDYINFTTKGK